MRFLTVLCALALVIGFATVASAETQNVKVSGDLGFYTFWRDDMDLTDNEASGSEAQNWFMTQAELQVDADLTDNVATCIRLVHQRDWDDPSPEDSSTTQYKTDVDLAYVELKEMLYSPLTLKIGRQDVWFGQGFVIGAKLADYQQTIIADEYTALTAFDAIRATLDYDPWTIDLVYAKIEENANSTSAGLNNDDIDLYIANVGYVFDSYNGEAEAYYIYQHDRSNLSAAGASTEHSANEIDTIGIRGSFDPVEDATLAGEIAGQFGDFVYDGTDQARDRRAMAFDISGEYRFVDMRWSPVIGGEYIYLSGETNHTSAATDDFEGWNQLYVGKSWLAIREWHNVFYDTDYRGATNMNDMRVNADQDSGVSNQQIFMAVGSIKPTENLMVEAKVAHIELAEKVLESNAEKDIGNEIDLTLTYDYTEDVTFGLLAAWFLPGGYFPADQDDKAVDVVGSVKVSF